MQYVDREPYYYLDGLIKILLLDDDPGVAHMLSELFRPFRLFRLEHVTSSFQGVQKMRTPDRVHLAVLDLGLKDMKNDEFYLLKKFSRRIAFIILTGNDSALKGFNAHKYGAKFLFEKGALFDRDAFIDAVITTAFYNIINPAYGKMDDTLSRSTDILFEKSPKFVGQWAQAMGLTDRALRNMWSKNLGANTKIILSIYHILDSAFRYYRQFFQGRIGSDHVALVNSEGYIYLEEFFHTHKSSIVDYLAYGDIASLMDD